jgi:methionine synthase II (cobalamin-independent)
MNTHSSKIGRKDKRHDEKFVANLCQALRSGNTKKNACLLAGCSETQLYKWLRDNDCDIEGTLANQFAESIKKSIAEAQNRNIVLIQKAAQNNWTAAAWYLERSDPSNWGRREKHEVSGPDGGPIETMAITERSLDDASLEKVLDKYTKASEYRSLLRN